MKENDGSASSFFPVDIQWKDKVQVVLYYQKWRLI